MPEIDNTTSKTDQQEMPKKKQDEPVKSTVDTIEKKLLAISEYSITTSVLAAKVDKRQEKIARLQDKNTALSNRISNNNGKIAKQTTKLQNAEQTKLYCQRLLATQALPQPLQAFFTSMLSRQDGKIERCKAKITRLESRNTELSGKITANRTKIEKHFSKIERLQKIDKFLTNMLSRKGRRENFVQAISDLKNSSLERNTAKSQKLENKIAAKELALSTAVTAVEKVKLRNQIQSLKDRKSTVDERIQALTAMTEKLDKLTSLPEQQADKVIVNAAKSINNQLAANQNMSQQMVIDTVLNETGKAITNNEIDNRTTPQNEEKAIIEKLNGEISDDLAFFGEVTYETAQHIKEAGYELKGNNLQKVPSEQNTEQEKVNQQENTENQTENRTDKQTEKALDVAALCAAIPIAFAENHDIQTRLVHTTAVFSALAENFNFDDVKSAVAIGIMDRKDDTAISDQSKAWAIKLPLTDTFKPFADTKVALPLDIKSGYLDVFAKKVVAWEQSRQEKSPAVFSRKDIIGSKPKEHEGQPKTPQHDKSLPKKTDQSL